MSTSASPRPPEPAGLTMRHGAALGAAAGVASHLPWLVLSRVDALRTFAVAMLAVFLAFDPWLTVPLVRALRESRGRGPRDAGVALVSGLVAGCVAALTIFAWDAVVRGVRLGAVDLAGLLVYPALAVTYAVLALALARAVFRAPKAP